MSIHKWKTAYASVIGTSHQKNDTTCQDAGLCSIIKLNDESEVLLAIVSDGAGSASRSEIGSKITVNYFLNHFGEKIKNSPLDEIDRSYVLDWLRDLNAKIKLRAENENLSYKEFACTALAAIVCENQAIFFQVGDGAIIVSAEDSLEYGEMFWPQHGEFANQTNFILQENLEEVLEFASIKQSFETIILFTDGIERLVLDFSSKRVHTPSFRPIVDWLKKCSPSQDNLQSSALISYLNSEFINSRTDDDKTLVIATRSLE